MTQRTLNKPQTLIDGHISQIMYESSKRGAFVTAEMSQNMLAEASALKTLEDKFKNIDFNLDDDHGVHYFIDHIFGVLEENVRLLISANRTSEIKTLLNAYVRVLSSEDLRLSYNASALITDLSLCKHQVIQQLDPETVRINKPAIDFFVNEVKLQTDSIALRVA